MIRVLEYNIDQNVGTIKDFLRENKYPTKIISILKRTENGIMVNDKLAYTNFMLSYGDRLTITIKNEEISENIPENIVPFEVIYEDLDILVVDKPPNVASHPSFNHFDTSLASGVKKYLKEKDFVYRCVNRLDKDTSGLLIIAKNRLSAAILIDQVKKREIKRTYLAIVDGNVNFESGFIDAPIARDPTSIIKRMVDFENGDYAKTYYEKCYCKNDHSLLKLQLETGRTHQIRVHLLHFGHPIIGDFLYNPNFEKINRQALHSYSLEFSHPITNENMFFRKDMPVDMQNIFR